MLKVVEGIYKDGNVAVKVDELPDIASAKAIVIFVKNDMEKMDVLKKLSSDVYDESEKLEISEKEFDDLFTDLKVSDETELKIEQKPFSVKNSRFFSMPPEHLGKTSASDLDKILAEEALGRGKWKKSS
jgi:hypothetical protein